MFTMRMIGRIVIMRDAAKSYGEEVTTVMKGKVKKMVDIVSRHPDTPDCQKRPRYAKQVLPNKFSSKT